ncbi:uncharacterized protein LOC134527946 [Bacillus rossius redtenbacheri]|uniref:uncharacterized protein LOC134527946 n=1 Tax=Bacillus rossius redtenbacheri TaxID=93214 RepID=UPI002FDD4D8F
MRGETEETCRCPWGTAVKGEAPEASDGQFAGSARDSVMCGDNYGQLPVAMRLVPDSTLLPEFAGEPHENPRPFVRVCKARLRHVSNDNWVDKVCGQLRGGAWTWWTDTGSYVVEWEEFVKLLERRFDGQSARVSCQQMLYSERQAEGEGVEAFIHKKVRLYRHLDPEGSTSVIMPVICELLLADLRPFMRGATELDLSEFVERAREVEADVQASRLGSGHQRTHREPRAATVVTPEDALAVVPYQTPTSSRGARTPTAPRPGTAARGDEPRANREQRGGRPPRCQYCRSTEYHWHGECPTRAAVWAKMEQEGHSPGNSQSPTRSGVRTTVPLAKTLPTAPLSPPTNLARMAVADTPRSSSNAARATAPHAASPGDVQALSGAAAAPAVREAEPASLGRLGSDGAALLRVPVRLNGRPIHALVDPAATHSYVVAHLVEEGSCQPEREEVLLTTEGASAPTSGRAQVNIEIRNQCSRITCLVMRNLREDLILGLPWLIQEEASINVSEGKLHVGRQGRRMVYCVGRPQTPVPHTPIRLAEIRNEVPQEYQELFEDVLAQQPGVFATTDLLRRTTVAEHSIPTKPHTPIFVKPHGFGTKERQVIQEQIDEMLQNGIIEPSEGPYNSRVVMARKKDGTLRFCVNFKAINSVTILAPPPLINITDALAGLGDATIFSSLDLKSGYWRVPLRPADRPKTAFTAPDGRRFQFCRLARDGLTFAPHKCRLGARELQFLGHLVNAEGCRPLPEHLDLIAAKQAPRTRKQLQRLLVTAPMTDFLSPKTKYRWTAEADHALNTVKRLFRESHTLARLRPDEPLYLQTDASQVGMGAILYQLGPDGERRVIEYASAKFGPAARRYDVNEQECLAVVWAGRKSKARIQS